MTTNSVTETAVVHGWDGNNLFKLWIYFNNNNAPEKTANHEPSPLGSAIIQYTPSKDVTNE